MSRPLPHVLLAAAATALLCAPAAALAQDVTNSTTVVTNGQGQPVAVGTVTASQPVANPPPATTPPTTVADTGYTGPVTGGQFYDVEARIDAAMAKMQGNARAEAALRSIKAEARMRRARHGGELRDWDREFLDKKLQQVTGAA